MYTFQGENKIIILSSGTISFDVIDLYSKWKEWVQQSDNLKFLPAFTNTGGDLITGSLYVGSYFFLENNWKIRPQEADHNLTVNGNLFTRDSSNAFIPTIGDYTVTINVLASSLSQSLAAGADSPTLEAKIDAILAKVNNLPNQEVANQHSVNVFTEILKNK